MDGLTRWVLAIIAIILAVVLPIWSVWMIRRHWIKQDPAVKHRRTETMMMQPFIIGVIGPVIMPILSITILIEMKRNQLVLKEAILILGIGLVISVFFVCYGTRQVLIYDYDRLRHRPAFGKMRIYDFSEIRSMTPIIFDLLVHVGGRWILIDMQQDWHPLWNNYITWRKRNGLSVKRREYKTALGRAFGEFPGGIGVLVALIVFFVAGAALFLFLAIYGWRDGQIGGAVGCLLFAVVIIVSLILILVAATKRERHPRFSKTMIGNLREWGTPRRAREKQDKKDESSSRDLKDDT